MEQSEGKPKFYQPDQKDLQEQKRQNIMTSIHQQQKNILTLLEKYKDLLPDPSILDTQKQKPNHKNIDHRSKDSLKARNRSATAEYQAHLFERFKLPTIEQSNKGKKASKGALQAKNLQKKKKAMEGDISRIYRGESRTISVTNPSKKYNQQKIKFIEKRLKPREKKNDLSIRKEISNIFDQSNAEQNKGDEAEFVETELQMNEKQIMKPIYYKKNQEESRIGKQDSDSDNQGEVPIKFYEREWQKVYEEQCKEQMNFLYFSTTAEMKEWSQQIVQLFEKHDEDLAKLHKKNRFLDHFDENYFLAQIYKHKQ